MFNVDIRPLSGIQIIFVSTVKNLFPFDKLDLKVVAHTYMHLRERYNHRELHTGRESDKRKRK